jgi:hypothetical protein
MFLVIMAAAAMNLGAAVPPAEQLLPSDTMGVFTIPDWAKSSQVYGQSPALKLWHDPEMKAFKEKFMNQFQSEILTPLERELGVKFDDYSALCQGQFTLAFNLKPGDKIEDTKAEWFIIIDSKDKADQLAKTLADLKKKWTDGGKQVKTEKIRDVEFSVLSFTAGDLTKILEKAFPKLAKGGDGDKSTEKQEFAIGQSGSLLLMAANPKDLEKVLARQAGGQTPCLDEQPEFQSSKASFRDSLSYGWVNLKPALTLLNKSLAQAAKGAKENSMSPQPEKIVAALGFDGLKTISFSVNHIPEGDLVNVSLGVPEAGRKGLFKMLIADSKNTAPPAFVPADVSKFNRWRLDGQKLWASIEAMIQDVSPQISGMLQMGLAAIGKDKDPNFDLKKSLIGNLGDDFVSFQKTPRDLTLEGLSSPPSILLIGSANADQLAQALKTGVGIIVPAGQLKERDFNGKKVISMPLPNNGTDGGDKTISYSSSGGYVAFSTDTAFLEEYLRGGENKGKSLEENTAIKDAAQKIGGLSTGLFTYDNVGETMRTAFEILKKDKNALDKLLSMGGPGGPSVDDETKNKIKEWCDFSLLPDYQKVSKYFYFTVATGSASAEGLSFKTFSPNPPELK